MCKLDHLFKKYKQYRRHEDRKAHIESKHLVNMMPRETHNRYIEQILGITNSIDPNDSNANPKADMIRTQTLSLQKSVLSPEDLKMDSKGSAPLKQNCHLYINTTDKANILNQQFQSVFTPKTPLKLSQLSCMTVQTFVHDDILHPS